MATSAPSRAIGDRGRASHAGVAAGYERLPPREPSRATIGLLAVVGRRVHLARQSRPVLYCRLNGGLGYFPAGSVNASALAISYGLQWQGRVKRLRASRLPMKVQRPETPRDEWSKPASARNVAI